MLLMVGVQTSGMVPTVEVDLGWSLEGDHLGEFITARCTRYDGVTDPETLEVLACRDALRVAVERGITKLVVETDCSNVKSMWDSKLGERSVNFHILCEMKTLVNNLQGFKLLFASRSSNQADRKSVV